jgi:hypothetical protein
MSDHIRSIAQTQGIHSGAYLIRLDLDHPDLHRASRVLSACGGCEVFEWAGTVYRFITTMARDNVSATASEGTTLPMNWEPDCGL